MSETVWINGEVSDGRIPVTDSSVLRGDGCFEVLRAYKGEVFAIDDHLDRLERSAAQLEISLPPRDSIAGWVHSAAEAEPDGAIRVVVTRGSALPGAEPQTNVIVFSHRWERSVEQARLALVRAPWHSGGSEWELRGAKVLSYAPNMAASRSAQARGFDDALLMTDDGVILEGPTFSIAWVVDGVIETPSLDLGILDSITRRHVIRLARDMGHEVLEGIWKTTRLADADEVLAVSTIRQVQPVIQIGDWSFEPGPVTAGLAIAFAQLVGSELSTQDV